MNRFRNAGFNIKLLKCEFCKPEIEYVGHMIGYSRMSPKQAKVQSLLVMGQPQSKRQLQSLLGLYNYYRRYISNFSTFASPLFKLLKGKNKFIWNDIHNNSFTSFKNFLASKPTQQIADFNKQFYI